MQLPRKKLCPEDPIKKERHIVTWTQQEDDILREQINLHGTENWTIIASTFQDKTTRQCRRRWYTYLNSDFKKGGWSPEEDILLCEAQKIFGNRWTEIAKVVSGRTDNAVKNRFSTLCKKKAKYEAIAKENATSFINPNKKRVMFENGYGENGSSEDTVEHKRIRRIHTSGISENCTFRDKSKPCGTINQQLREIQNYQNVSNLPAKQIYNDGGQKNKGQGTFLRKDDPKITRLMQQAELLSSLAVKVNTENTDQSLENAWKVLQDFLNRSKENELLGFKIPNIDLHLEDIKDYVEEMRRSIHGNPGRQPDLHESPGSSEYSTGSTFMTKTAEDKTAQSQAEVGTLQQDVKGISFAATRKQEEDFQCGDEQADDAVASSLSSTGFTSPIQVIPIFRSLAAGIPSPQFSESEKKFLHKTLGLESPSLNPSTNISQPPTCKRALLQSL